MEIQIHTNGKISSMSGSESGARQRPHSCCPSAAPAGFDSGPSFIILNLAVGGSWPGSPAASTPFPS
jgi:hypothetical protein